jgi:hypothetical protein
LTRPSPEQDPSASPPSLTDAETFGEDLAFNLQTVTDLAEKYCGSCQGYHVLYAAKRLMPLSRIVELDREEIAATIRRLAEEQLSSSRSRLEVVIAGAADTGLLATAAHGIALIGRAALSRSRFTVLDRCRTPLELCLSFGRRHQLTVATEMVDLVTDGAPRAADLVVVHSLLRYLPQSTHVDVLGKLGQWLRPEGRIVLSSRLEDDAEGKIFEREQRDIGEDVVRRIREGQLNVGESADAFDARLSRRTAEPIAGYRDLVSLRALPDRARMPVLSVQVVRGEILRSGKLTPRSRAIIVLGAP